MIAGHFRAVVTVTLLAQNINFWPANTKLIFVSLCVNAYFMPGILSRFCRFRDACVVSSSVESPNTHHQNSLMCLRHHSLVGSVLGFCVTSYCTFSVKNHFFLAPELECLLSHILTKFCSPLAQNIILLPGGKVHVGFLPPLSTHIA